MISSLRFFMIFLTVTSIIIAGITKSLTQPVILVIISILILTSIFLIIILNLLEHRDEKRKKIEGRPEGSAADQGRDSIKRSSTSFSLKDRKSGFKWGGGNIKASEAQRGVK